MSNCNASSTSDHEWIPNAPGGASRTRALEVFLSHATADASLVATVQGQLEALGIRVYLAEHDPQPGTPLAQKIGNAIRRSSAVVVLITSASVNSAYVQQEIGIAHECGKPLVPIVEKGVDTRALGILQGIEFLELDVSNPAETLSRMTARLQPLVLRQLAVNLSFSITPGAAPDAVTAILLVGLGLMLGVILMTVLTSASGDAD